MTMRKLIGCVLAVAALAGGTAAQAATITAAQVRANIMAVRSAARQVVQTKGSTAAVADFKVAVQAVVADVQAVRADTSATKQEIVAARVEAIATRDTIGLLKAIAAAAKARNGS